MPFDAQGAHRAVGATTAAGRRKANRVVELEGRKHNQLLSGSVTNDRVATDRGQKRESRREQAGATAENERVVKKPQPALARDGARRSRAVAAERMSSLDSHPCVRTNVLRMWFSDIRAQPRRAPERAVTTTDAASR